MSRRSLAGRARALAPTVRYWMTTEVHVFGFAIAANVLLSAFPFLIVMGSLCRNVLRWPEAEGAIYFALRDYFPGDVGDFMVRNLKAAVGRGPVQFASILLLFFTANGIFEPLEVALNRAFGVEKDRSFWGNQIVSFLLIFAVGALVLTSVVITAFNPGLFPNAGGLAAAANAFVSVAFYKAAAVPISIVTLFLVYWRLPNRRMSPRALIAPSVIVGIALEALKYINYLTWPTLNRHLKPDYGPFINSVTILLWSFLAAMVVLAGAEWAGRDWRASRDASPQFPDGRDQRI